MLLDKIELGSDERVVKTVRKHWFIFFSQIIGIILLWTLPIPLLALATWWLDGVVPIPESFISIKVVAFFYSVWTLIFAGAFYHELTDYFLDVWLITNERIIAIDQQGLFKRSVASFRLERMQEIDVDIVGIIPTFLDFGTLRIDTAGRDEEGDFKIHGLAHPREVKSLILEAAEERQRTEGAHAAEAHY